MPSLVQHQFIGQRSCVKQRHTGEPRTALLQHPAWCHLRLARAATSSCFASSKGRILDLPIPPVPFLTRESRAPRGLTASPRNSCHAATPQLRDASGGSATRLPGASRPRCSALMPRAASMLLPAFPVPAGHLVLPLPARLVARVSKWTTTGPEGNYSPKAIQRAVPRPHPRTKVTTWCSSPRKGTPRGPLEGWTRVWRACQVGPTALPHCRSPCAAPRHRLGCAPL